MEGISASAIAIAGVVIAAAGTAATVYSSIKQQDAIAESSKAEQEARDVEAASAREAAAYEERQFRRRAGLLLGKQSNLLAASGLEISGTPMMLELDAIQQTELEALNIRRTGNVSASAKEFEGRLAGMKGRYASSQIGGIALGGTAKIGSTLLGSWSSYTKAASPRPGYYGYE